MCYENINNSSHNMCNVHERDALCERHANFFLCAYAHTIFHGISSTCSHLVNICLSSTQHEQFYNATLQYFDKCLWKSLIERGNSVMGYLSVTRCCQANLKDLVNFLYKYKTTRRDRA